MPAKCENIKSGVPFVRFYGNDWYTGCAGLKADERGVYISMCVYIWNTGKRVPLDDAESSRMLGLNFKSYQRVRDRLVVLGKVTRYDDGYGNDRAELELQAAHEGQRPARRAQPDAEGRDQRGGAEADPGLRQAASKGPSPGRVVLSDPIIDHAIDRIIDPMIEVEKTEEILRANKEPITNNQEKNPQSPQGGHDDMPRNVRPISNWNQAFAEPEHAGVIRSETGRIQLVNGTRALWLEKFGDDADRLDLALIEIAGQINTGSRKDLSADVQSRLARMAGQKRDSDKRYQQAVEARAKAPEGQFGRKKIDLAKLTAPGPEYVA